MPKIFYVMCLPELDTNTTFFPMIYLKIGSNECKTLSYWYLDEPQGNKKCNAINGLTNILKTSLYCPHDEI